jgi:hypothetical protein
MCDKPEVTTEQSCLFFGGFRRDTFDLAKTGEVVVEFKLKSTQVRIRRAGLALGTVTVV